MVTQNVTASLQGRVGNFQFNISNWLTDIRNASTGTSSSTFTTSTNQTQAIRASNSTGRSGQSGSIYRTFLFFNCPS